MFVRILPRGVVALAAVLTVMAPTFGQVPPAPPDAGNYPEPVELPRYYPDAVTAPKGMVAAAHPLAARIGADVLRQGGNAIDAMVAVQMALTVVEPQSSGIGGGCFIVYHDARGRQTHFVDGREEVPAGARRSDFLQGNGKLLADPLTGGTSAGVPGTVAAMWLAHTRWGRLPIAQLLEPAIRLCEEGVRVTPRLQVSIAANHRRFLLFSSSKKAFLREDGSVPELGELRRQPELARTLRLLAQQGPRAFYEGEIARDIVEAVRTSAVRPGRMTLDDLKAYRAVVREPVRFSYRGHEIVSASPPSSGGITVGMILGLLEGHDLKRLRAGSVEEVDLLARAGAVAFADRNAYLGDADWSPGLDMRQLLRPERLRQRAEVARSMRPGERVRPGPLGAVPPAGGGPMNEGEDTTHFSIVDAERNVVSCTTTIENGMGCGLVVPGRGFLLNNELTDFDLEKEGTPNALDTSRRPRVTATEAATTVGGKRPRSSMAPVIVFRDGKPWLTAGSPGGARIIGVVAQVLINVIDHDMDIQQAINAPRVSSQNGPLALEGLYPERKKLEEALRARGWKVQAQRPYYEAWGGAHGIRIRPDGTLEGGADPRREGALRGY